MENKKILIISLYGNNNYGNKLQNYSLQEVLKSYNYDVHTLISSEDQIPYSYSDAMKISFGKYIKFLLKKIMSIFRNIIPQKSNVIENERISNIKKFDKLIKKSEIRIDHNNYEKINNNYNYIVFGSDQVWNPNYITNYSLFLGRKISKDKKFSYAASLGVEKLEDKYKKLYKTLLYGFNEEYISVREDRGAEIINDLNGFNVEVVLDPTMLLDKSDWLKLAKEPSIKPKKEYILTYILGTQSDSRRKIIDGIANKNNYEVINMMDKSNIEIYNSGVEEFLWYIANANLILADSFHAGVFSILFEKEFYIINREENLSYSMNSRFDTLLVKFNLEDRFVYKVEDIDLERKIDYASINKILEEERKKSFEFLDKIIKN